MARYFTAKAAKDYPQHGIKKGDTYYYWTPGFRGVKQMSLKPPRQSQLTTSKMSAAYAAGEALDDAIGEASCIEDITSAMEQAIDDIRSVAEEYDEAANATTGNGNRVPNADEMEEKAQGLNDWADSLESDKDEIESLEPREYADMDMDPDELPEDLVDEEEVDCDNCDGEGKIEVGECDKCAGTGKVNEKCDHCDGNGFVEENGQKVECEFCDGAGTIEDDCGECDGEGVKHEECMECEGTGQITKRVRKDPEDYDDLTDDEKQNMLDAALDIARNNTDCPL